MLLTSTSDIIRITTTTTASIDVYVGWADITSSSLTAGRTNTAITTATTTTIVASPGASTQRQIKFISVKNKHATASNVITIELYDGSIYVQIFKCTLLAGEALEYNGSSWIPYSYSGVPLTADKNDTDLYIIIDDVGAGVSYSGKAEVGSLTSAVVWQIKKIVESGDDITITIADGNINFDNIWDNRAALTYS